jgi:hypothetical protein
MLLLCIYNNDINNNDGSNKDYSNQAQTPIQKAK